MRPKEEIITKSGFVFRIASDKAQDENEWSEANYYSGAWHALVWVLEEIEII
jgi:hypothetical protein